MNTDPKTEIIPASGTKLSTVVSDVGQDVRLVARDAEEMKAATGAMAVWFAQKEQLCRDDAAQLRECVEIATKQGWSNDALERQARIAADRAAFYEKCRQASEAGYCIVPNMPGTVFAVRTARDKPSNALYAKRTTGDTEQRSESPPAGEGKWVSATPKEKIRRQRDGDKVNEFVVAANFKEVEFPISIARPELMSEAAIAMALKCFDELQIVVDSSVAVRTARGDPLILGIIRKHNFDTYNDRRITFLIGWYLDTSTL